MANLIHALIIYTIMGVRALDFLDDNGKAVKGTQLFVCFPEPGVTGHMTEKFFVRDGIQLPELKPTDTVNIYFSRKGKVEAVSKAAKG